MSNVKVVKVDNMKIGGAVSKKKTKKQTPKNIEYLQSIVRETKKNPTLDLTNSEFINMLLEKKSKKNMDVRISKKEEKKNEQAKTKLEPVKTKAEPVKTKAEPVKTKVEPVKTKVEPAKAKVEPAKAKVEPAKAKVQEPKNILELKKDKIKHKKQVGKKATKKTVMSFFSPSDQRKIKQKTKRAKKIISANLKAPIIGKKTKKNFYKHGVKNILTLDKKNRKELDKISREELQKVLIKNKIIEKDSNAPTKVLKDLYHLYLLVEANISK